MKKYKIQYLPHWVLTDLQPAFYDTESGTVLQQTAKIYGKIQELINTYNDFVTQVNRYISEFEEGIIKDFNCFQNCMIKTMNDYIETIDTKINLQDTNIENKFEIQDTLIANKFNEQDSKIDDAINYMKNNIVETTTNIINQAIENGDITVSMEYDPTEESLNIIVTREGE